MMRVQCAARAATLSTAAVLTFACSAQAAPAAVRPADATSPDARGRAVLKAQLEALKDEHAFMGTFADKAVVLTPFGASEVHLPDAGAASAIAGLNPHAQIKTATFDHFTSGSAGQVAWFAADLHITVVSHEPQNPPSTSNRTVRAIELLDGTAGWKVTVAAFTSVSELSKTGTSEIREITAAGPLTNLLTSPTGLASELGTDVVIFGTDPTERGIGVKDAKTLLGKWKNVTLTLDAAPQVHEFRGPSYGYAMANMSLSLKPGGPKYLVNGFVLALPSTGNKWLVVGASFGAL